MRLLSLYMVVPMRHCHTLRRDAMYDDAQSCRPPLLPLRRQIVDADHLGPLPRLGTREALLAVAAWFAARDRGTVRLIDNTTLLPVAA